MSNKGIKIAIGIVTGLIVATVVGFAAWSAITKADKAFDKEMVTESSENEKKKDKDSAKSETKDKKEDKADEVYLGYEAVKAYRDKLEGHEYGNETYLFFYLDDDVIPELAVIGECEAEGVQIYSYNKGEVKQLALSRLNASYIPKEGVLINDDGHMGYYYDSIYQYENGTFDLTFDGTYGDPADGPILDENGDFVFEYFIDGKKVSEDEYTKALDKAVDQEKLVAIYDGYDSILEAYDALEDVDLLDDDSWSIYMTEFEKKDDKLSIATDEDGDTWEKTYTCSEKLTYGSRGVGARTNESEFFENYTYEEMKSSLEAIRKEYEETEEFCSPASIHFITVNGILVDVYYIFS